MKIGQSLSYGCSPWVGEALASQFKATKVAPTPPGFGAVKSSMKIGSFQIDGARIK
jgi:hypothetical protein